MFKGVKYSSSLNPVFNNWTGILSIDLSTVISIRTGSLSDEMGGKNLLVCFLADDVEENPCNINGFLVVLHYSNSILEIPVPRYKTSG
jgi:hypothetical protein